VQERSCAGSLTSEHPMETGKTHAVFQAGAKGKGVNPTGKADRVHLRVLGKHPGVL